MDRNDYLREPVIHIEIKGALTVNQLMQQFSSSGSFGAGRLAAACDTYERMIKDPECTIFLGLSGAVIPAGMRTLVADLIRHHLVDVIVSTGACMVHDAIEAIGGHHYKGGWAVDDKELYKYHLFRIYDIFVPEEDYVKLDYKFSDMYTDIAKERKGGSLGSDEFTYEIGTKTQFYGRHMRKMYQFLSQQCATQNLVSFTGFTQVSNKTKITCLSLTLLKMSQLFAAYVPIRLKMV
jgi:deoxyhypusine synthase